MIVTKSKDVLISRDIVNELKLFGVNLLLLIALSSLLRLIFLIFNFEQTSDIPLHDILVSFLFGVRFDLVVISWFFFPLLLVQSLRYFKLLNSQKLFAFCLAIISLIIIYTNIIDLEFYHEFHARLNNLIIQYLKEDSSTVLSMIWHGFPVLKFLSFATGLWLIYLAAVKYSNRKINYDCTISQASILYKTLVIVCVGTLLFLGSRGSFRSGPPLRWGDAYHSQYVFTNHLALNATFTLIKSLKYTSSDATAKLWLHGVDADQATAITKKMILTNQDQLLNDNNTVIRRTHTSAFSNQLAIKNVVLILMESFAAEFVGAVNTIAKAQGVTPEFDKLASDGVLFTNYFSNGTHTHQGMFNSVVSFPNLPGHEYLMQMTEGSHKFSGLPRVLSNNGYNNVYVYNGVMTWDNQEGFFRNQGMSNFIGKNQFDNPKFLNPTWGVSDEDMFNRSLKELDKLHSQNKPFFALLQTLSNHTPFILPSPLPFEPIMDNSKQSDRLTAMKYSDWALGRFFDAVKKAPYYKDTVFVIIGDHGFGINKQLTAIDLYRFHVPMLIIGKDIQNQYGKTISTVTSHLDLAPTVLGLVNKQFTHQCWGRDVLSLPKNDQGFAVIKPSGNEQTVAIIRGDHILIKTPDGNLELGKYQFSPHESYTVFQDESVKDTMHQEMMSFVSTALRGLKEKDLS